VIKFAVSVFMAAALSISFQFFPNSGEAKVIEECIYLVPAGKIDKKVLEKLKEKLPGVFPMSVKVVIDTQKEIPQAAYDTSRKQYNAQTLLDDISQRITLTLVNERALVVTDVDLYMPDLNFIFGLADAKKGICIISLARLAPDGSEEILYERALKEAAHELGHSWNIPHCPSPKCIMFFSNSLADTDKKRESFCYKCRIGLENRSGGGGLFGSKLKQLF
jgi:archaemetzincin